MAHAILFDTLKYTETLMEAGIPAKQAKAQTTALLESYEGADLATKADLEKLEIRLDARFSSMDARFTSIDARFISIDAHFTSIEKSIDAKFSAITWVLGMVATGMVALLIKTFF